MSAQERPQLAVMVLLVFNDVVQDVDRIVVAQVLQLPPVVGDVAALFDLQPAQGHAHPAGPVGQRIRLPSGAALVDRLGTAQFHDPPVPECGVFPLRAGQVAQNLRTDGIGVAVG
jgi:hypothetical protein